MWTHCNKWITTTFNHIHPIISNSNNLILFQYNLPHLISGIGEAKSTKLPITNVIEMVPPVGSILQDNFNQLNQVKCLEMYLYS